MEATAAREASLRQRDIMRKARRGGNTDPSVLFADPQGFGSLGGVDRNTYTTEVAYSHDKGEPHAATRPINQRIAGQPIHVAEVVNAENDTPTEKAWREPKKGRRRLSIEEMAALPRWLRNRLRLPTADDRGECVKTIKSMHSAAVRVDILEQHPVLDLLAQPNPRMNGHTLIETSMTSLMYTGKCFWWLWQSRKRPYDLFYIPAHRVREAPDNVMLDQGYLVTPPKESGSGDIPIPAKWMIYFYHPDPVDPMKALAPIRAILQNVRVGESITTCQEQTFNNGLYPGLAVITGDVIDQSGKNLGKAQMDRFQINEVTTRLEQFHKQPMKFNKPLIMDRVIDKVQFLNGLKPHEMSWIESAEFNRDAIFRGIGTPRVITGDINDANRATALVADEAFIGNVLNPRTTMLSHVMNDHLLPLFSDDDSNLIMWIEECVSADRDAKLKELTLIFNNRGMTVDGLLSELGYPPLPNGKGAVLRASATDIYEPLDDNNDEILAYREELMDEQAQAGKPAPANGKPRDGTNVQKPPPSADETATGKSFDHKNRVAAWLKIHGNQERMFAADIKRFLDAQVKYIVSQIDAQVEPSQIFNPREWDRGLINLVKPHLLRCAATGAQNIFQQQKDAKANVLIELSAAVVSAIRNFLSRVIAMPYWREINDTTGERLKTQLQEGLEAGDSIQQMSKRVKTALDTQTPARALMIARTETTMSLNAGAKVAVDDLVHQGLATGLSWLATDDAHTRPTHWAANGQKQDENGEFTVGGEKCSFPCDPRLSAAQRINCRCSTLSVLNLHDRSFGDGNVKALLTGPGEMFERVERRFIVDSAAPIIEQLLNHGKIREYGIKTLYLDRRVPTWSLRRGTGVKFRLRRYDTGELYFEQKVKRDGMTYKKRRKTTLEDVGNDLIPVGLASYTRTEFEQNGSRVTVDREVCLNGKAFARFIVEVKGKMPEWLNLPEGSEQVGFSKSSAILSHCP